ncbi:MAG: ParB/RepB/Spo0J family partition protein [Anaerobiospirillum sp.]|nr:ParB/RepB/Spo0J family partition protein [Anaerobiospirillum sp.]
MAGLGRGLGALLSQSTTKSAKVTGSSGVVGQDLIVRSLKSKGATEQDVGALQVESNSEEVLTPEVAPAPKRRTTKPKTSTTRRKPKATATPVPAPEPSPASEPEPSPALEPELLAPESVPLESVGAVQGNLLDDVTPEQEAKMQQILDETRKRTKPKRCRKAAETVAEQVKPEGATPEKVKAKAEPKTEVKAEPKAEPASMDTAPAAIQAHMAAHAAAAGVTLTGDDDNRIHQIALSALNPSSYQPRDYFDDDSIKELASSILEHGLLEPLIVKRAGSGYEIICGERRYRAAKLAGLTELPCLVRDVVDEKAYAIALIENIQRESLNPIELAIALEQMMEECGMTQEQVAASVGKSRSAVANYLRLTTMNEQVQEALRRGDINFGHAKLIVGFDDVTQLELCSIITKKQLSVRATEDYIKKHITAEQRKKRTPKQGQAEKQRHKEQLMAHLSNCEATLNAQLGGVVAKFTLATSAKNTKGKLTLSYNSEEELEALLQRLGLGLDSALGAEEA